MAVTVEDLYRSYGVLADAAKDTLSQVGEHHTDTRPVRTESERGPRFSVV